MKHFTIKSVIAATALMAGATGAFAADYQLSVNTALATSDPLYKGLEAFRDNTAAHSF